MNDFAPLPPKELTDREKLFVKGYMKYLDPEAAAVDAGFSPWSAYTMGRRMIKRRAVAAALKDLMPPDTVHVRSKEQLATLRKLREKAVPAYLKQKATVERTIGIHRGPSIAGKIAVNELTALKRLGAILNFNIKDLFDRQGQLIPIHQLKPHITFALEHIKISVSEEGNCKLIEFRCARRQPAIELAMRYLRMLSDPLKLKVSATLEQLIAEAEKLGENPEHVLVPDGSGEDQPLESET